MIQKQINKKGSIGIQVEKIVIEQADSLIKQLFYNNFIKPTNSLKQKIDTKIQKFSDNLLTVLSDNPDINIIKQFDSPDFQYILTKAEIAFVRIENTIIKETLLYLMKCRIIYNSNYLLKTTIDDAIEIIPNLSEKYLDILSLLFLVKETYSPILQKIKLPKDERLFSEYLKKNILPFTIKKANSYDIRHLYVCKCCLESIQEDFQNTLIRKYPQLCTIAENKTKYLLELNLLNPNFKIVLENDKTQYFKDYVISLNADFKNIFVAFNENYLYKVSLSTLGILLGICNYNLKIHADLDLNTWFKN